MTQPPVAEGLSAGARLVNLAKGASSTIEEAKAIFDVLAELNTAKGIIAGEVARTKALRAEAFFDGFKSGESDGFFAGYEKGWLAVERNPATAWKEYKPARTALATIQSGDA